MEKFILYLIGGSVFAVGFFILFIVMGLDWQRSVWLSLFTGTIFIILLHLFTNSDFVKKQVVLKEYSEHEIVYSGGVNYLINIESVGGHLYIIRDKLVFKPHSLNAQRNDVEIKINDIKSISFFNMFSFIPNGLMLTLNNGSTYKFVVYGRKIWKEKIMQLKTSMNNGIPKNSAQ